MCLQYLSFVSSYFLTAFFKQGESIVTKGKKFNPISRSYQNPNYGLNLQNPAPYIKILTSLSLVT